MKTIYIPGVNDLPEKCEVGLFLDEEGRLVIVASAPALLNSDEARDSVLNQILTQDAFGIRAEFIRFIAVTSIPAGFGKKFEIRPDFDDCECKGMLINGKSTCFIEKTHEDIREVSSLDCVAGACRFCTDFESGTVLTGEVIGPMLKQAGLA
jgi:hypothetical protein